MNTQQIQRLSIIAVLLLLMSSCVTRKDVNYLQDMTTGSQIELENRFVATISNYDELSIHVSCYDAELATPFNLHTTNMNFNNPNMANSRYGATYLVDQNGNIQFPVLGDIHVAGMTRLQLQEHIAALLRAGNYIADPYVMVRFANFTIFMLSPTTGKSIAIHNEHCNLLQALAQFGGLDNYTRRDKVAVIREVNGKVTMRYLDPRSTEIYNDPYFILQQNDMILLEPRTAKYVKGNSSELLSWAALLTSIISTATSFYLLYQNYTK